MAQSRVGVAARSMNVADSGPLGVGDNALELSNGTNGNFAMYNDSVFGVISQDVTPISVDILRPQGEVDAEIRLVLFSNSLNRWTSTDAAVVSGDGLWNTYTFSILESDLTRVTGSNSYDNLVNNFNRIMFRYDPGSPSSSGTPLVGSMRFDNVIARSAVPEPGSMAIGFGLAGALILKRRRK